MWASSEGHLEVVKALLAAGADPNIKGHVADHGSQERGSPFRRLYSAHVRRS